MTILTVVPKAIKRFQNERFIPVNPDFIIEGRVMASTPDRDSDGDVDVDGDGSISSDLHSVRSTLSVSSAESYPSIRDTSHINEHKHLDKELSNLYKEINNCKTAINRINGWIKEHDGRSNAYWDAQHKLNDSIDKDIEMTKYNITKIQIKFAAAMAIIGFLQIVGTAVVTAAVIAYVR